MRVGKLGVGISFATGSSCGVCSTSACCDHLQHVKTQLPYALTVGVSSLVGFVIAGFLHPLAGLPVTLVCILAVLMVMKKRSRVIADPVETQ